MLRAKSHLHSLGFLSQLLQRSPATIEDALDSLGIAPVLKQNGIGYYDEDAFCQLADKYEWHPEIHGGK